MNYSVTEAARVVGKSRMTIIRAIAAGTHRRPVPNLESLG